MFARKFVKGVKVKVGDSEFSLDMAARQCCKRSWKWLSNRIFIYFHVI